MLAMTSVGSNTWWYLARAGGLVAWGLLAASVFWGLIYAGRLTRRFPPPAWNLDLHQFLGALSVTFVAIHVAALAADPYTSFGPAQLFIPFADHWHPWALAWGITAMYLVIAVEATSLAMRWLPRRLWKQIHLLSFALFGFSTIHAIQVGTDMKSPVVQALGIGLLLTAVVVAALRVDQGRRRADARRPAIASPAPSPGTAVAGPRPSAAPTVWSPSVPPASWAPSDPGLAARIMGTVRPARGAVARVRPSRGADADLSAVLRSVPAPPERAARRDPAAVE